SAGCCCNRRFVYEERAAALPVSVRIQAHAFGEHAFAGHVIELEANPRRIFKQDRIIARRPGALLWRTDDGDVLRLEKGMDLVEILAAATAEADMMQPDAALVEALARMFRIARADADRRPPADEVEKFLSVEDLRQSQKGKQRLVEGPAL